MVTKKASATKNRALESLQKLGQMIEWLDSAETVADRDGRLDAVAKRFEVAFEYVWKHLKAALEIKGEEVYGPKDTLTFAGRYGWIDNLEKWAEFLQTRNAGVHDYYHLTPEDYAKVARSFLEDAQNVLRCTQEE